ncbi:MAG TPA: hypothetical protein VN253_15295 [Kofleriaceae bacterium]|nr:hypothetical protein [Kofleriaceae bacterium]
MAVAPEIMTELLELPELERADLAWRLLESLRDGSDMDDLDEAEREQLHQALARSAEDERAGRTRPAATLLEELRNLRAR